MKAGHAGQYRINVNAPQVHKKYNLKSKNTVLRIEVTNLETVKTKTLQKKPPKTKLNSQNKAYLQLDVNTDGFVVAQVGVGTMLLQESVSTDQDIAQPLQDLCIIDQLSLNQFLGYGE